MRNELISKAKALGYDVLDLEPIMRRDYERNTQKFEYPRDTHWNEHGHRLFAGVVLETNVVISISGDD